MRRVPFVFLSAVLLCTLQLFAGELPLGNRFAVAIEDHDLDAVKALVEVEGAAVDTPIDYGESVNTPLEKAAWVGDLPIVEYLIAKGANVNARDSESKATVLWSAVSNGHTEIVKALIAAKADVALRDKYGASVITTAAAAGNQEIAGLLLDAGANVGDAGSGLTPLAYPVSSGNVEMIRFLVGRGADVNQGAKTGGQTALITAILGAKIESVKTLIELKANVNTKMKDGTTPLELAQKGDQEEIIALLKAAGAKE